MALHWKILIGLVAGIVWSFISSSLGWNGFTNDWISPFGEIFIRMLKFIALPLVLFSVIGGITGLEDLSNLKRMGAKTIGMYLVTTLLAVTTGLFLVNLIQPGKVLGEEQISKNRIKYELWVQEASIENPSIQIVDDKNYLTDPQYASLVKEVLKDSSLVSASAADVKKYESKKSTASKTMDSGPLQFLVDMVPENILASMSANKMLQVIFFAIFFGLALVFIKGSKVKVVIDFINGTNEVFLKMVDMIMKASPFFVFALLAGVMTKIANTPQEIFDVFKGLGSYSLVVIFGLFLLAGVFYPLLVLLFTRNRKFLLKFLKGITPAQTLAFSTSSSAATLPVTLECVEENIGVPKKIASFVLPIGATVNMDGTSLYQAVAVIFLAQIHGIELDFMTQLTIVATATLASIGSAAVPSAGLVMLIIVLNSVSLNPMWVAIIFPVDRILDMCRTTVNVTGDAMVATVIAKSENEL